ncbi:hypothetical protein RHMOL_Rhmol03G0218300 [Rhododendron molle]|uniref:Uncharacterized protein n=1 Tax=Rhododendron molle TaxID=49168 RepID=A0ACC0PH46_RHOML|nr:hypothetical protein RHMOL_Rhmol03G0218300 [Rhododendron molle]
MGSATEPSHHDDDPNPINNISRFIQSTASNLSSLIPFPKPSPSPSQISASPSKIFVPLPFADSRPQLLSLRPLPSPFESTQADSPSSSSLRGTSYLGLRSAGKGGPAFVGRVFSMCDLSGTGLMAVSTHFDIPFISKRTPEWIKKLFASVAKSERNGPVFRFFIDVGDAVSYVRKLNIPSGVVGACHLTLAYEHFKEKPHLFQFVPNETQVKEANKLLKLVSRNGGRKKIDGVPVFSARNMDIAIATADGIKWYTPYFFDKNLLDTILEESVDQHFHALIQTRRQHRDVFHDDDSDTELIEETGESISEPPEVMRALTEVALDKDIFSDLSSHVEEAAKFQLLNAVDKVLLGNRWLRKATGIQPKFPYIVDSFEERYPMLAPVSLIFSCLMYFLDSKAAQDLVSFNVMEELHSTSPPISQEWFTSVLFVVPRECPQVAPLLRTAASLLRALESSGSLTNSELRNSKCLQHHGTSELTLKDSVQAKQGQRLSSGFPFGDWCRHPFSNQPRHNQSDKRVEAETSQPTRQELQQSPLLPRITMVGVAAAAGEVSKFNLKEIVADLTRELEHTERGSAVSATSTEPKCEDRDPLFVANLDGVPKKGSPGFGRWFLTVN